MLCHRPRYIYRNQYDNIKKKQSLQKHRLTRNSSRPSKRWL